MSERSSFKSSMFRELKDATCEESGMSFKQVLMITLVGKPREDLIIDALN